MVDSKGGVIDNVVEFPSIASEPLPRSAACSDADFAGGDVTEFSEGSGFPPLDFSLPSFDHETRTTVLIIAFSFAMTLVLAGAAFGLLMLTSGIMSLFTGG